MDVIYTSIDDFRKRKWAVKSYKELPQDFCEWIEENTCKLLENKSKAERIAGEELRKWCNDIYEQPFFNIHGRSYFLDYYIPLFRLAIEIDGRYHKIRRLEDAQRDKDFQQIGIRTIRISDKDVLSGKFIERLREKTMPKKLRKGKKRKTRNYNGQIVNYC